jgi:GT2 family glycosyltransferase
VADDALGSSITLVLLTYNCAHRIDAILDHALALGTPVVAVDNGSRDATADKLRQCREVDVVALPHNIGAAARNIGVQRARTPYVAFCDDDGWFERDGLVRAAAALDRHPRLALVNGRILVGPQQLLDPISAEMAASPLPEQHGVPGAVILGFMAGAVIVRVAAFREVGGYDLRFFIGGEEETVAVKLARNGWLMRYRTDVVVHHEPSIANAPYLRPYGMRNTLWNTWQHRRVGSALRWTGFTLADSPKNGDWFRGLAMAAGGFLPTLRRRSPMPQELDRQFAMLDERRFRGRRPWWNRHDPLTAMRESTDRSYSFAIGTQRVRVHHHWSKLRPAGPSGGRT